MQVLLQLTLEVQRIVDRVMFDLRIELVDLGQAEAAGGQRPWRLRLQTRVGDVRGASELARHDPQARAWPVEVRSACPLSCPERVGGAEQLLVAGVERALAVDDLGMGLG
jgi:hypothetical protein